MAGEQRFKTLDEAMAAVCEDGEKLAMVPPDWQEPVLCLAAIAQNPRALRHVQEQTPRLCLEAIIEDPQCFKYVKDPTPALCAQAVKLHPEILEFIENQTQGICIDAVSNDVWGACGRKFESCHPD